MVVQSIRFNGDDVTVKYVCLSCGYIELVKTTYREGIKLWGTMK